MEAVEQRKESPMREGERDAFHLWVGKYFLYHRDEIGVAANEQVFRSIADVFDARIATLFADQTSS
jgi:hypothetical protein